MKKLFLFGYLALSAAWQTATTTSEIQPTSTSVPQSSPVPITTAITFTLSPAFTSTSIPLFFTDEFNGDTSAWTAFQTGGETNPTLTLENDLLRLDISSPNTWYYAATTFKITKTPF